MTSWATALIEDGYLSEAEKAIFLDRKARKEFARTLFQLKDDFWSAREEIRDTVKKAIEADFEDFCE